MMKIEKISWKEKSVVYIPSLFYVVCNICKKVVDRCDRCKNSIKQNSTFYCGDLERLVEKTNNTEHICEKCYKEIN